MNSKYWIYVPKIKYGVPKKLNIRISDSVDLAQGMI